MSSLPQKLDLALVTRLRQVVAGEVATEAELRALDDEAGGWLRATGAQLRAAEDRLTNLNADPAAPLAEIATEVRRVEALSRERAVGRGEVGEIALDARRELVRLVVTDDAKARFPPGAMPATT